MGTASFSFSGILVGYSMHDILEQIMDLPPFVVDIIRLSIWLFLLMLLFTPLERLFALRPQKIFRKSFFVDLGYFFLTGLLPRAFWSFPSAVIAWGMHRLVPGAVHHWTAALPLAARLAAALVVGEVGFYWGHRWTHEIPCCGASIPSTTARGDGLARQFPRSSRGYSLRPPVRIVPLYARGPGPPAAGMRLDVVPLFFLLVGSRHGGSLSTPICAGASAGSACWSPRPHFIIGTTPTTSTPRQELRLHAAHHG